MRLRLGANQCVCVHARACVRARGGKRGRHSQNTMESTSEIKHKKVERQEEGKKGGGIVLECVMRVDPVK